MEAHYKRDRALRFLTLVVCLGNYSFLDSYRHNDAKKEIAEFIQGISQKRADLEGKRKPEKQDAKAKKVKGKNKENVSKQSKKAEKKKLTLLIYMAGDNNLEPYVEFNRRQIEREGVPDDVHMCLFMCTHRVNEQKMAIKAVVKDSKTTIIEKIANLDSGDKNTLRQSMEWAVKNYPSENFGVILWDHGFGPLNRTARRGICYDNTTGHFLSDNDIREVFDYITKTHLKKPIDIIGFDACLMGSLEIAAAIQPCARYMIASEQTIPAVGWPYHLLLREFKSGAKDPESFCRSILRAYSAYYKPITQDFTLSLIDLTKLQPLTANLTTVADILIDMLAHSRGKSVAQAIRRAGAETIRFDEPSYADLYDWYKNLLVRVDTMVGVNQNEMALKQQALKKALADGLALASKGILATVEGSVFSRTRGTLIYLPENYLDRAYATCHWAKTTKWTDFIKAYLAL